MELLSVAHAKCFWVVDVNELNPRGKNLFTEIVPAIVEEHNFQVAPQEGGDFSQGMRFNRGRFRPAGGDIVDLDLIIWSDGVSAETRSFTKDADEFIEEILRMLPEFGLTYRPDMIRRKVYNSQLNVRCSRRLTMLNAALTQFGDKLSHYLGGEPPFEIAALELWPDPTHPARPAPNFSFQRKVGEPPSTDRYWSQAPLPTDIHLQLLDDMESLLLTP
jgi:hypothetical protein